MRYQTPRRRGIYWTFWKVVIAGWMIRYPRQFFIALGFCVVVIYNVLMK